MDDRIESVPTKEAFIVGLRFQKVGKIYHFDADNFRDLRPGDFVIVDTSRGRQMGQVIQIVMDPSEAGFSGLKPIIRKATPQDLLIKQNWQQKETEVVNTCRSKVTDLSLVDVKIIGAEFSIDGNRLSIMYCSEAGEKTDLRGLRRSMQRVYQQTHVEMHLVGPRDEAKILGGMGACGLENRCCSTFLTDFSPISIKMAKEQGISLTPTEITGMCGRLRCCLVYEYEQYAETRKSLPKKNKRVLTSQGEGRVVDILPLKQTVVVELDQGGQREYMKHEIQLILDSDAMNKKPDQSVEAHSDQTPGSEVMETKKRDRSTSAT